jgi:hypothetical protein
MFMFMYMSSYRYMYRGYEFVGYFYEISFYYM